LTIVALAAGGTIWANVAAYRGAQHGLEAVRTSDPLRAAAYVKSAVESGSYASTDVLRTTLRTLVEFNKAGRREWEPLAASVQTEAERFIAAGRATRELLELQGKAYNRRGPRFSADAERVLRQALSVAPRSHDARFELSLTLMRRGDIEGGLSQLREVVDMNDRYAKGHWILGVALVSQKRFGEGQMEVERALALGYRADPSKLADIRRAINNGTP
jgi:Flp pilus assembly protein TadD